jgi:hypothetical protein
LLLNLMCLGIFLLFCEGNLDFLKIQKLWAELEGQWKFILKLNTVSLDLGCVLVFEFTKSLGIFFLGL